MHQRLTPGFCCPVWFAGHQRKCPTLAVLLAGKCRCVGESTGGRDLQLHCCGVYIRCFSCSSPPATIGPSSHSEPTHDAITANTTSQLRYSEFGDWWQQRFQLVKPARARRGACSEPASSVPGIWRCSCWCQHACSTHTAARQSESTQKEHGSCCTTSHPGLGQRIPRMEPGPCSPATAHSCKLISPIAHEPPTERETVCEFVRGAVAAVSWRHCLRSGILLLTSGYSSGGGGCYTCTENTFGCLGASTLLPLPQQLVLLCMRACMICGDLR